jgi:hypothetical protein
LQQLAMPTILMAGKIAPKQYALSTVYQLLSLGQ